MATTETRTGFRLPWSTEHRASDSSTATDTAAALEATDAGANAEPQVVGATSGPETTVETAPQSDAASTGEASRIADALSAPAGDAQPADAAAGIKSTTPVVETTDTPMLDTSATPIAPRAPAAPAKRPTKFLADLTNAMRTAAEAERAEILERFRADAKAFVELVHERSGGEATELRKQTDDDIAGIRDWSKAEIARIREETDERIAHRKARLDRELEAHAARIEREVEQVNARVEGFEASMTRFFEGLLTEDDPTSFAELAANLPEPPSLEDALDDDYVPAPAPHAVAVETVAAITETTHAAETGQTVETIAAQVEQPVEAMAAEAPVAEAPVVEPEPEVVAVLETAPDTEPVVDEAAPSAGSDAPSEATEAPEAVTLDPRVAALGLSPDFAAAEAEAFQGVDADHEGERDEDVIPALDDETIAARLAGIPQPSAEPPVETVSTQVVVTGLVSVASIAGFKRHLSRLPGIRSVGVSSGPEGEFLFTVTHGEDAALNDAIPTIPGFAARITKSGEGVLQVTAHDPEADA